MGLGAEERPARGLLARASQPQRQSIPRMTPSAPAAPLCWTVQCPLRVSVRIQYMQAEQRNPEEHRMPGENTGQSLEAAYLPDPNQVGVLTAAVLLTYALTRLGRAPGFTLTLQLPGFYFAYALTLGSAMTLMAAGLTASGMDWLLRSHPTSEGRRTIEHWLLPASTAFIIGVLLDALPPGSLWWAGFVVGAVILISVLVAEYVAVDPGAPLYSLASAGLTALSYAIFLLFVIALRIAGARLFLVMPAIFFAAGLVTLRTLHLRLSGRWEFPWAFGIGLVSAQLAAGLHYWPLSSLQFGLILLGPLYALTALAYSLGEDVPLRNALTEPILILAALWAAAILLR